MFYCTCHCTTAFPHSFTYLTQFSFRYKRVFMNLATFFYLQNYTELHKIIISFSKHIKNEGNVTLGTFRNFIYVNSYLLKKLFHENEIGQYFKTANAMSLTKAILESPHKVLQMQ